MAEELKRTPLYEAHLEAGAKLVPFAGWEMPVQYAGIREEHQAVRSGCGVFDVSHMGEVETEGPDAERLLQRLVAGGRDRFYSPELFRETAERIPGARLALYQHKGHAGVITHKPAIREIVAFLRANQSR